MKTSDIWFASWLKTRGYKLLDFEKLDKNRGRYTFDISTETWKKEKLAFSNSDVSSIKLHFTSLKDLLY